MDGETLPEFEEQESSNAELRNTLLKLADTKKIKYTLKYIKKALEKTWEVFTQITKDNN